MFAQINELIKVIDDAVWGLPLICLIMVTGILLTVRLGGVQVRHLGKAFKFMFQDEEDGHGEVTSFGALCTALSATIGTGNIAGVATAIAAGGPGALFWMVVAAFFGMATKYSEGLLAIKYRTIDQDGHVLGGPFYYIENGMGKKWKWLAKIFAFFGAGVGLFGIGTFTQVNSIASAVKNFFDPDMAHTVTVLGNDYSIATVIAGILLTVFVGLVVIGGIKRISKVSEVVVPFMAVLYVVLCLIIVFTNIKAVPGAFAEIISSAFNGSALAGGVMGSMIVAMQKGVARGIFSNESGLGSAPIAAAAARTKDPVRQGLVSMTGTFIDTIVICSCTAFLILLVPQEQIAGLAGMDLLQTAMSYHLGEFGVIFTALTLGLFSFSTFLGILFYARSNVSYLCGEKWCFQTLYKVVALVMLFIGGLAAYTVVWDLGDVGVGLMTIFNLIALYPMAGEALEALRRYEQERKEARSRSRQK